MKNSCQSTSFFHGKIQFKMPLYHFIARNAAEQAFCISLWLIVQ